MAKRNNKQDNKDYDKNSLLSEISQYFIKRAKEDGLIETKK
jgi:hypothetical protein